MVHFKVNTHGCPIIITFIDVLFSSSNVYSKLYTLYYVKRWKISSLYGLYLTSNAYMLCINVSVYQCFVLMLVLWEETFVFTCKRTHPAMMPSTSFFPCHPCPALTSPGRLWVPPHYPVASGHSQALLKPAGIQSQL